MYNDSELGEQATGTVVVRPIAYRIEHRTIEASWKPREGRHRMPRVSLPPRLRNELMELHFDRIHSSPGFFPELSDEERSGTLFAIARASLN